MATITGTATNYQDFWDKLIAFLTTNSVLVAASQQWTVAWSAPVGAPNSTDVVLKGPGLAGLDSVYIGLRLVVDVPGDRFAIHMCGMTGVLAGATQFNAHVNCTPKYVRMFLSNAAMTYWFVANGRRFIAAAKVSTVYETMYGGLLLPFSQPEDYPYPLFVGGTAGEGSASVDWRSVSADHASFWRGRYDNTSYEPCSWFLSPEGSWLRCATQGTTDNGNIAIAPDFFGTEDYGLGPNYGNTNYGYKQTKDRIIQAYGGSFPLYPMMLLQSSPVTQTFAMLHGVYYVPGRGNSAENTVTLNGVTHLVLQNTFRTLTGDYAAIALET